MSLTVLTKNYTSPPLCEREILRYAGCKADNIDGDTKELLKNCLNEVTGKLCYRVCYIELPVKVDRNVCDFGCFSVTSENLSNNLSGCKTAIIFAATVGVEIDRLIAKYGRIAPSKALMFQAIGAERIEAVCDTFCEDIRLLKNRGQKPRFSPGYGDLPLDTQNKIFDLLTPQKRIGVTLNESLLMSPSKSVTAIVGITENEGEIIKNKCAFCDFKDCAYRGVL